MFSLKVSLLQITFKDIQKLVLNVENSRNETREDVPSGQDDKLFFLLSIGLGALSGVLLILLLLSLFLLRSSHYKHDNTHFTSLVAEKQDETNRAISKCPGQSRGDMNQIFTSDPHTRCCSSLYSPVN